MSKQSDLFDQVNNELERAQTTIAWMKDVVDMCRRSDIHPTSALMKMQVISDDYYNGGEE